MNHRLKLINLIGWIIVTYACNCSCQTILPTLHDSLFGTYYYQKVSTFKVLPIKDKEIIFVGNSITDSGEWSDIFDDKNISNMGISGDISAGVLHRFQHILTRRPNKIFLMIGTNDLARNISPDSLLKNIRMLAKFTKEKAPQTSLYIQSILPVSDFYKKFSGHSKNNMVIQKINTNLAQDANLYGFTYIDIHSKFIDKDGKLNNKYSNDGLHLTGDGYHLWKHSVFPYVYDLKPKPSLIPKPQKLSWKNAIFPLYKCTHIHIQSDSLISEANFLKAKLNDLGWRPDISLHVPNDTANPVILLKIDDIANNKSESYRLSVNEGKIEIVANTKHGIFNGIQSLLQLSRNKSTIDGCEIEDWPAFSWRGFMIDVGRNYVSPKKLKEVIDKMASYKLNIFHFHPTEDIAWRIEIQQYPQLTWAEHMLRNKGMYYSKEEIQDLIKFCKERYITLIPEIDMPGHSAAFKRAMKTDMQSDTGLMIVKNILKEICDTYDVPYIHIGADEVKITNMNFIPEVTALIEGRGKKVVGWQPGGNFNDKTIRQLWLENKNLFNTDHNLLLVDSRHLYLNHMDPLEAVTTIFFRKIGGVSRENKNVLGAILCVWHDRAIGHEDDIFTMNPVYQGIVTFSERSWVGDGKDGWVANIGSAGSRDALEFNEYETRLLDHKSQYFKNLPFGYTQQSSYNWNIFGPYKNEGDVHEIFEPEIFPDKFKDKKSDITQTGGTIILRHWWAPAISSILENPQDSSTWYATTKIWSDHDTTNQFWIGFNNFSRSQAPDSPPAGSWDNKGSNVWVNGIQIGPPKWKRSGHKVDLETPLVDESYEFRIPTPIKMNKGWNYVMIKAPIGTFKTLKWNNPAKWMFTFVKVP